jgi:two-component system, cell cycle sensor histidine kinase and response regulator CckA
MATEHPTSDESYDGGEALYRALIEATGTGYVILDLSGRVLDANREYLRLAGREEMAEILGHRVLEWTAEEEKEMNAAAIARCLTEGSVRDLRVTYLGKGGERRPIGINATVAGSGDSRRILSICRDESERTRVQEALRRSEERFRKAFTTSPDAVNINRMSDGVYLQINEGFTAAMGYTEADVIGRSSLPNDLGIWTRDEDRNRLIAGLKASGEVRNLEAVFRAKDGHPITGLMSARVIELDGEACILSITRDISALRAAERDRAKFLEANQRSQKLESLAIVAGGIAHDFNNILGGIYGNLDLALDACREEEVRRYLSKMGKSMQRATSLTRQLLTFAKGGAPATRTAPLFPFIEESVAFALSGSPVTADFSVEAGLWPCRFDEDQLGQVMDNLVINAKQAMPSGGSLRIRAENASLREGERPALPQGNYVRIAIADRGTGIPPENLVRIFDPFFTTKPTGSGLGLATSYSIIKRHGGSIEVESTPGEGSTFSVYLPAASGEEDINPPAALSGCKGSGRVLVMDDDDAIRAVMTSMLERLGYEYLAAADGKAAVTAFSEAMAAGRRISAVILDLTVPGNLGGKEALKSIRELDPGIPVFVASGYADDPTMADPVSSGFTDKIDKPFTLTDLDGLLARNGL